MRGTSYRVEVDDVAITTGCAGGAGPSHAVRRAGRGSVTASPSGATLDLILTEVRALRMTTTNLERGQEQLLSLNRQQTSKVDQITNRVDIFVDYTNDVLSSFPNRFNVAETDPIHFLPPPVF